MADSLYQYQSVEWHDGLPVITTERLVLRIASRGDVESLLAFSQRNAEHFRPWFPTSAMDPTREDLLRSIETKEELARCDSGYRFNLFARENQARVIGLCSVSDVRRGAIQQAVIGYGIDKDEQAKGLMKEAVSAAVKFAFDDLDIHRLECSYMISNIASGRIAERLGFKREGMFVDYLFLNNKWQDHFLTSLINSDWSGTGRKIC